MPRTDVISLLLPITLLTITASVQSGETNNKQTISSPLISSQHKFSQADDKWQQHVNSLRAVKLEAGCGRMQNRLVTFEDGSKACARYRLNTHLMQGEIYSYALGKLLGITNLAPLATSLPDLKVNQWSRVPDAIHQANWQSNKLVILTKYIPDATEVVLPEKLKSMTNFSITPRDITPDNAEELAQWSDMIVFDYIVGNMDRLVNSLHNQQWNANIMKMPIHNLMRKDNSLIFLDNEDGLFHGYQILDRYSQYHEQSLQSICVFRESTYNHIKQLLHTDNLLNTIQEEVKGMDPRILKYLPKISNKTIKLLRDRLSRVFDHINNCSSRYS